MNFFSKNEFENIRKEVANNVNDEVNHNIEAIKIRLKGKYSAVYDSFFKQIRYCGLIENVELDSFCINTTTDGKIELNFSLKITTSEFIFYTDLLDLIISDDENELKLYCEVADGEE